MDYKKLNYNDSTQAQWDSIIAKIPAASYFHSWHWLDYCRHFQNVVENSSFILTDNRKTPLAVCPLFLSDIDGHREISIKGIPAGTPALSDNLKPGRHRKILDDILTAIGKYAKDNQAERIFMTTHPLTQEVCTDNMAGFRNKFELLGYWMLHRIENTLVIDLTLPEESLLSDIAKARGITLNTPETKE